MTTRQRRRQSGRFPSRSWVMGLVLACAAAPVLAQASGTQRPGVGSGQVAHKPKTPPKPVRAQAPVKPRPQATAAPAPRPSVAALKGLRDTPDPLELSSSVALVVDEDTREVLLRKNDSAVLPIASLTKLMTALVISESALPLDEAIVITQDDVDTEKHTRSRLQVGTVLTRGELLHLALMSSENRAAHALGRTFPGGMSTFVTLMNARATQLGMMETRKSMRRFL